MEKYYPPLEGLPDEMKWRRIKIQTKNDIGKAQSGEIMVESKHIESLSADLSDRNTMKMQALTQVETEFIISLSFEDSNYIQSFRGI